MYPIVAEVTWYDEVSNKLAKDNVLLYSENLSRAMRNIENYYGDTVEKITLHYAGEEGTFFTIPDKMLHLFIENQGAKE